MTQSNQTITLENWKRITDELPWGNYLVTNNINARTNSGTMSHLWHVNMVHKASGPAHGPFTAFTEASNRIWGVTHFIDLSPLTQQEAKDTQLSPIAEKALSALDETANDGGMVQ